MNHHDFRGFAGRLSSGTLQVGDHVVALPSLRESTIKAIYKDEQEIATAHSGDSVTITLTNEIDISRGDMLVLKNQSHAIHKELSAQVCWLDHEALQPGKTYLLQHGINRVKAKVSNLFSSINVQDFQQIEDVSKLGLNEIGFISLRTAQPVFAEYLCQQINKMVHLF